MRADDRSLAISAMSDRVEVGEPLPAAVCIPCVGELGVGENFIKLESESFTCI